MILCLAFMGLVYLLSREPLKTLCNYPPAIQARVKSLPAYEGRIPTQKDRLAAKLGASVGSVLLLALIVCALAALTVRYIL